MYANITKSLIERLKEEQNRLSLRIVFKPLNKKNGKIAGVDVSYKGEEIFCSVVILSFPELKLINVYNKKGKVDFPYIPGFLSFREMPIILNTFDRVKENCFLIFCDGQGIAHPRGFGLASHIGTLLKIPSIGCAKSRLVGEYTEPDLKRGSFSKLIYKGIEVGVALRTRENTKPIFVSAGNYIDLESSIYYTLCCARYRIPEPTRLAHKHVTLFKNIFS
ncbi:MAG: endonuclease V [Myxococcota bacterium]